MYLLYLLILLTCVICSLGQTMERDKGTRVCHIEKYAISCALIHIAGHNVSVLGTLYPCARPIYIQFQVKKSNMSKMTEYTFINSDETQRMRDFDQYLAFHCVLKYNREYAFIKAGFLEESIEVYFVEDHMKLPNPNDCPTSGSSTSKVFPIVIVAAASVVMAAAASALLIWWYNKRKRAKLQARELLSNMETSPNSTPYQEEPISSVFSGPRPGTTTVIQNTVYRDSVNLDAILDPIPEEEGSDCSRMQRAHRRRQKHAKRDKKTNNGYKRTRNETQTLDTNPTDDTNGRSLDAACFGSSSQSVSGVDMLISTDDVLVSIATEPESLIDSSSRSNKQNGLPIAS